MELVRAALGDHIDHRARITPVFCVEGVGDDAKLLDRVRRRFDARRVHKKIVPVAAVHAEVVRAAAAAIHRNGPGLVAAVEKVGTANALDAWLQLQQLISVAAVQRQVLHRPFVDHRAQLGGGRVDQGCLRGYLDGLGTRADHQLDVVAHRRVQVHQNSARQELVESGGLGLKVVGADWNRRKNIVADLGGLRGQGLPRRIVGQRQRGVGDHGIGWIEHPSQDSSPGGLRQRIRGDANQDEKGGTEKKARKGEADQNTRGMATTAHGMWGKLHALQPPKPYEE